MQNKTKSVVQDLPGSPIDYVVFLWRAKLWIFAGAVTAFLFAILLIRSVNQVYTAEVAIAPSGETSRDSSVTKLSQLATSAGRKSSSARELSPFDKFLETISSVELARTLEEKHKVSVKLFPESWDSDKKIWRMPGSFSAKINGFLKVAVGQKAWLPPGTVALADYLKREIRVKMTENPDVKVLSYQSGDQKFVKHFLGLVLIENDQLSRLLREKHLDSKIEYLTRKMKEVTGDEYRDALIQLLVEEEKERMLLESGDYFAIDVIRPISVSNEPTFPRPIPLLALSLFGGGIIGGIAFWLLRASHSR
ncbi:MAG: hypothetical protein HQ503_10090 [Rhodospirillales bacterium]|nr:hypothetical protein [Rhodospirillales bacterium]